MILANRFGCYDFEVLLAASRVLPAFPRRRSGYRGNSALISIREVALKPWIRVRPFLLHASDGLPLLPWKSVSESAFAVSEIFLIIEVHALRSSVMPAVPWS